MPEYADQESHFDPLKSGFGMVVILSFGDSTKVFRALGLALWISGHGNGRSSPVSRDQQNQVLGKTMILAAIGSGRAYLRYGAPSTGNSVCLFVFSHGQVAALFPKQEILVSPPIQPFFPLSLPPSPSLFFYSSLHIYPHPSSNSNTV